MDGISRIDTLKKRIERWIHSSKFFLPYLFGFLIISLITFLAYFIRDRITPTNLVMPYLLGVVSIAVIWGRGPAVFASVLGVIAFDIFLIPPYLTLVVEDTEYIITFLAFFIVGVVISNLTARIKQQMVETREREARVSSLYHLSHELAAAYSLEDVTRAIIGSVSHALEEDVWLFLTEQNAASNQVPRFQLVKTKAAQPREVDEAVLYAYQTGEISGYGTLTYNSSETTNLPLVTKSGVVGVISISSKETERSFTIEQVQLYEAFANLAALAIERVYLNRQASEAQLLKAKEEIQTALLNSVSHDFRTPLVTITGTLSSLDSEIHLLDKESQREMIRYALREAEKMNRLVSNLLSMTRLESGALSLQLEPVDVQDLIGATLQQIENRITGKVEIQIPDDLPLIYADFVLVGQALLNILENAIKYSPEGSSIDILCTCSDRMVYIEVADRGYGIEESEIPKIFQKFYPVKDKSGRSGTGLGLTIVKGILDCHGAELSAALREGGGMIFRMGFTQYAIDDRSCSNVG